MTPTVARNPSSLPELASDGACAMGGLILMAGRGCAPGVFLRQRDSPNALPFVFREVASRTVNTLRLRFMRPEVGSSSSAPPTGRQMATSERTTIIEGGRPASPPD